jgi:cell division topological specificity factor
MSLFSRIEKLLGANTPRSKDDAKQRLKFLLIHDQVDLSPAQLEQMKNEIMGVIAKYVEVDADGVEFKLNKEDGHIALVSSVPVRRVTERASAV